MATETITYQQQRRAIREACKELEKELTRSTYDDVTRNDLTDQLEALKQAVISIDRLEQLAQLLKKI